MATACAFKPAPEKDPFSFESPSSQIPNPPPPPPRYVFTTDGEIRPHRNAYGLKFSAWEKFIHDAFENIYGAIGYFNSSIYYDEGYSEDTWAYKVEIVQHSFMYDITTPICQKEGCHLPRMATITISNCHYDVRYVCTNFYYSHITNFSFQSLDSCAYHFAWALDTLHSDHVDDD
jgi:hypothetical protein